MGKNNRMQVTRHEDLSQLDAEDLRNEAARRRVQEHADRQHKRAVRKQIVACHQETLDLMALKECGDDLLDLGRVHEMARQLAGMAAELAAMTQPERAGRKAS